MNEVTCQTRTFSVLSSEQQSIRVRLSCSFPQGSTLGTLLYVTYAAELQTVAKQHGVRFHGFADDTQLSISVNPEDAKRAKQTMIDCVSRIRKWSSSHCLKLNASKSEVIWLGSCQTERR